MQKWEYMFVEWGYPGGHPPPKPRSINFVEIKNWERSISNLQLYCNQLGDEGWELADVAGISGTVWVFKRPKP